MATLGDRLVHLLEGDFVRLETPDLSVRAEVVTNEVATLDPDTEPDGGHTVSFMPVGDGAKTVDADRFHVTVEPKDDADWRVGTLVADVFDEEQLTYVPEPRGELTVVERLELGD